MNVRPSDDPGTVVPPRKPAIVFVGGTGRSGTHALADLISHHRRYALVPIEARFHVNPQGFPDLLAGAVSPEDFVSKLKRFWWYRIEAGSPLPAVAPRLQLGRKARGLHKAVPRERFDRAVARFEGRRADEPVEIACRRLFLDLLWPIAEQRDRPGLVEMSTHTVARAPELARLFPDSKLIHIVRDGRDAGSSKVSKRQKTHHPRDVAEGVEWWVQRLERAERSIAQAPDGYVLTLSLDELAVGDRDAEYARILEFLGHGDAPRMREFFAAQMNAQNASRGRWREGLTDAGQREVARAYEAKLDYLAEQGYASAPLLRRVYERLG